MRFRSRADNSGTNVQEQLMWKLTTIPQSPAFNALTDRRPSRSLPAQTRPGTSRTTPVRPQNLDKTEACVVAGNGCYTMIDRGTFNKKVNEGSVTHLKIVAQKNTADVRGGENLLINPFSVYIVNPDKITTDPKPNVAAAQRFVDFITSPAFQQSLLSFPNAVDPAFRPDAQPTVSLMAALPQTAAAGSTVDDRRHVR